MEEKRAVLRDIRRLLPEGGAFLLVDVFLAEGESREDYLLRRTPGCGGIGAS